MIRFFKKFRIFYGIGLFLSLNLLSNLGLANINESRKASGLRDCPVRVADFYKERRRTADYVLLVPGAGADSKKLFLGYIPWGEYFSEIQDNLDQMGIENYVVPADPQGNSSVHERVAELKKTIFQNSGLKSKKKVLIIGHSLGGIVARVAQQDPEIHALTAGVVTLDSPNRGTEIVDFVMDGSVTAKIIEILGKAFGFDITEKQYMEEISTYSMERYNRNSDLSVEDSVFSVVSHQKRKDIYKSYAFLGFAHEVLTYLIDNEDSPWYDLSDGVIGAYSQAWGYCLGVANANHGSIIGKSFSHKDKEQLQIIIKEIFERLHDRGLKVRHSQDLLTNRVKQKSRNTAHW